MRRATAQHGFTMLELVLVLFVIALTLAVTVPSLRGWSHGSMMRNATDGFLAAAQWARSQAVAEARIYRLEFAADLSGYDVTVQQGETFVAADGELGRSVTLPDGLSIEMFRIDGTPGSAIEFHPSGRVTPARVRLTSDRGEYVQLQATTPAESFRLAMQVTR